MRGAGKPAKAVAGRGYRAAHKTPIGLCGIASGIIAGLVLVFYIRSAEVTILYDQPVVLWLLVALFLVWIGRLWRLAYRDHVHDDPVVFAVKDAVSYGILAASLLIIGIAA
jgi:hypothetical protein